MDHQGVKDDLGGVFPEDDGLSKDQAGVGGHRSFILPTHTCGALCWLVFRSCNRISETEQFINRESWHLEGTSLLCHSGAEACMAECA